MRVINNFCQWMICSASSISAGTSPPLKAYHSTAVYVGVKFHSLQCLTTDGWGLAGYANHTAQLPSDKGTTSERNRTVGIDTATARYVQRQWLT